MEIGSAELTHIQPMFAMMPPRRALLTLALVTTALATSPPTVHVPGLGDARGTISNASSTVALFLAIPYAKAPIGPKRWQPPTAADTPWASPVLDASKYGNFCVQTPFPEVGVDASNMSEDCLFVNVATPLSSVSTTKQARPLPVMVRFSLSSLSSTHVVLCAPMTVLCPNWHRVVYR